VVELPVELHHAVSLREGGVAAAAAQPAPSLDLQRHQLQEPPMPARAVGRPRSNTAPPHVSAPPPSAPPPVPGVQGPAVPFATRLPGAWPGGLAVAPPGRARTDSGVSLSEGALHGLVAECLPPAKGAGALRPARGPLPPTPEAAA
jgi:hypothetical protein